METSAVYILVDGHNRYGICLKHKLNFKIHLISFDSLKEVRNYMIDNQLGRRNLIPEQASYLRGLRYNTEKLEKGKYTREEHKGQNVPYDLKGNESTEKVKEIHKGQNVPYGSMAKKESTSARLSKQYNVSEKTIKRDAEFAEGLNLLSPELKKDILSGRIKAKKSNIQQLTQLEKPDSPIDSLDKISNLISVNVSKQPSKIDDNSSVTFIYNNDDSRENLLRKVKKGIKNASDSDVTVEIKGSFIIKNDLVDVWKKLRGFSEDMIIDEDFTDKISIFQTVSLGIVHEL